MRFRPTHKVYLAPKMLRFKSSILQENIRYRSVVITLIVFQLECSKVFIFKDEVSKAKYMEEYTAFRDRNRRRDEFMEHEEVG